MKLKGPQGQVVDVDPNEAARLIQTVGGWTEIADEGSDVPLTESLRTGAEAAAAVPTLGLSDQFLSGYLDPSLETGDAGPEIRARRERSPRAALLGSAGGAILTGGAGGGSLKGALLEGSMFGLSNAVSEDAMGDKEALGEKLLAHVGIGTLAGGVTHGLGLGLTRGADALSKKLANYSLKADLSGLRGLASKVRGQNFREAAKKFDLDWNYVDKVAKEEGIFTARSTPDAVVDMADDLVRRSRADALKALEQHAGPGGLFDPADLAVTLNREGNRTLRSSFLPKDARTAAKLQAAAEDLVDAERGAPTWEKWLDAVESRLASTSESERKVGQTLFEGGVKILAQDSVDVAEAVGSSVNKLRVGRFLAGKVRGPSSAGAADVAQAGALGAFFGGPTGAVSGALGALAGQEIRARAPFLTAAALEELGPGLVRAANGLQRRVVKVLETAPELLGPYRSAVTAALAEGGPELLRTHVELASSANGGDYLSRLGLEHESPEESAAAASRAAVLDTLEAQAARVDERLNTWAGRMVGGVSGPAPAAPLSKVDLKGDNWKKVIDDLRLAAQDPEKYLNAMPPEMLKDAPVTTLTLATMTTSAAQFLLSKAPMDPNIHLPENLRPRWVPSPGQLDTFKAAYQGVEDPVGALERMRAGYVNPATIEAIAKVYPRLWEEARAKLFDRVATAKNLSYEQRLRLQPILGPMATGSTPQQAAYIQNMHDKQRAPQQAGGPSPDGRQVVSTTQNLETQATRIEARGARTP